MHQPRPERRLSIEVSKMNRTSHFRMWLLPLILIVLSSTSLLYAQIVGSSSEPPEHLGEPTGGETTGGTGVPMGGGPVSGGVAGGEVPPAHLGGPTQSIPSEGGQAAATIPEVTSREMFFDSFAQSTWFSLISGGASVLALLLALYPIQIRNIPPSVFRSLLWKKVCCCL